MGIRPLSILLLFALLSACAAPPAAGEPVKNTQAPQAPTASPDSFAGSLLLIGWDPSLRSYLLFPVNPTTGQSIVGFRTIELGTNYFHRFPPDRSRLAIIAYKGDSPVNPVLHLIDIHEWSERKVQLEIDAWPNAIAFSPDGSALAVSFGYGENHLLLLDWELGAIRSHLQPVFNVTRLQFTREGASLMAYGHVIVDRLTTRERSQGYARVALYDARHLTSRWSAELEGVREGIYPVDEQSVVNMHEPGSAIYYNPAVVFSPAGDLLHILHAGEDQLTSVDFARQEIESRAIQPALSWFEQILMLGTRVAHAKVANGTSRWAVISPDGKMLYGSGAVHAAHIREDGEWEFSFTPLDLQVIRISDARIVLDQDAYAEMLQITPDGGSLLFSSWDPKDPDGLPSTQVLDTHTLELERRYAGVQLMPVVRMDGSLLLVSAVPAGEEQQATRLSVYDYFTGSLLAEWIHPTYASWLALQ